MAAATDISALATCCFHDEATILDFKNTRDKDTSDKSQTITHPSRIAICTSECISL
jgi:hypothetical protein